MTNLLELTSNPSYTRLQVGRAEGCPNEARKRRLFQLITDYQYPSAPLNPGKITLHCSQAGGLGDVSQAFLCSQLIQKNCPAAEVEILIDLKTSSEEQINKIFPTQQFKTSFLSQTYTEGEKQLAALLQDRYLLGIAQPIGLAGPFSRQYPHLRTVREYGFSALCQPNELSLGLGIEEEGIPLPEITFRSLSELQSPWIKKELQGTLYCMYLSLWSSQLTALYTVAAIEQKNQTPIDLFLPLSYSLAQLVEWKCLDLDFLKKQKIGTLILITPQGKEQLDLGEGKTIKIFSGSIPKSDMEIIQQHSEQMMGCTGDLSVSEAIALDKIPFYEVHDHKTKFVNSWKTLAIQLACPLFANLLGELDQQRMGKNQIYDKYTPKKICWFASEPSTELADENSLPRKAMEELRPKLSEFGEKIGALYTNQELSKQAALVNAYIAQKCNFESRLMSIVNRGLILQQHPELVAVEESLWERFKNREIGEAEIASELSSAIEAVLARKAG
jgi:hypothetical protein